MGARGLEAFAVHDGRAGLVVLLLGDPHLLEGGQRRQDGAADPHRVLALRRGDDLQDSASGGGGGPGRGARGAGTGLPPTLIFMVLGASAVISFCMRSAIPGYMVVPPDMTLLAYRSFLMSMSHFMMLL